MLRQHRYNDSSEDDDDSSGQGGDSSSISNRNNGSSKQSSGNSSNGGAAAAAMAIPTVNRLASWHCAREGTRTYDDIAVGRPSGTHGNNPDTKFDRRHSKSPISHDCRDVQAPVEILPPQQSRCVLITPRISSRVSAQTTYTGSHRNPVTGPHTCGTTIGIAVDTPLGALRRSEWRERRQERLQDNGDPCTAARSSQGGNDLLQQATASAQH